MSEEEGMRVKVKRYTEDREGGRRREEVKEEEERR